MVLNKFNQKQEKQSKISEKVTLPQNVSAAVRHKAAETFLSVPQIAMSMEALIAK